MKLKFVIPFKKQHIIDLINERKALELEGIFTILSDQLNTVLYNDQFQKALLWELSEKDNDVNKISVSRELISAELFQMIELNKNF